MNWWLGPAHRGQISAQRIDIGGIEEIDAARSRFVQNCVALRFIALKSEGHGPKAKLGDS